MLNLIRCEFWKLKRKMFVQLVLAASFLFPIPLTAIIYYLNTAQDKYATKAAAFDALWQSVIGFGMLLLLPCILGIVAALLFFMERDNDTFKNLRTIPVTSSQMVFAKCIVLLFLSVRGQVRTDCQHGAWNFQNSSASAQSQAASKIENFFGKHGKSIDQNHSPNGEISEGVYLPHAA